MQDFRSSEVRRVFGPSSGLARNSFTRHAIRVQWVAVKGLRRKLPKDSRYLFPILQISVAESWHISRARLAISCTGPGGIFAISSSDLAEIFAGTNGFARRIRDV